jgi:hypothetical protein
LRYANKYCKKYEKKGIELMNIEQIENSSENEENENKKLYVYFFFVYFI